MHVANWYSADLHFGHHRIIDFCKRPFASTAEMNATLIANFQACVRHDDDLWKPAAGQASGSWRRSFPHRSKRKRPKGERCARICLPSVFALANGCFSTESAESSRSPQLRRLHFGQAKAAFQSLTDPNLNAALGTKGRLCAETG
ncbi:hypothetical protein [Rhodovulum sulfidophilum]|uniref:hypothetical protein n=1 Tax=Rhodovulum sulfidophilum TaxID=35806 RepID=UPI0009511C95|nr:hypothetical protein [Rhodovulum sulfidophilum]OLS52684.1 hypothetical protein BV392_12220 [Rhodovulum sulfidophilum]